MKKLLIRNVYLFNPHTNIKKTRIFEYAGSARTPIAYVYHMKGMHSLGQFGPALFQGTPDQFVLATQVQTPFHYGRAVIDMSHNV